MNGILIGWFGSTVSARLLPAPAPAQMGYKTTTTTTTQQHQ